MPTILNKFEMEITTGENSFEGVIQCELNSFQIPLELLEGSTSSHQKINGSFYPQSVVHSLFLLGHEEKTWDIDKLKMTYHSSDEKDSYNVEFKAFSLKPNQVANIFEQRPLPTFSV